MRSRVYKSYRDFKNFKEEKGKLLKQQVFLAKYINDNYETINRMLLFHGIGTGKTCTSITIAETIMEKNDKMKTLVILPARLKTNFIDELLTETCGLNRYITREEYEEYSNSSISEKRKTEIMKRFMERISMNYDIKSYENLRKILLDSKNLKQTITKITENKIIIIDEVHNLLSSHIPPKILTDIITKNKIPKQTKTINGIVLRLLTKMASESSRIFLLTATPVFDNYGQFLQLLFNLRPDINDSNYRRDISSIVKFLKLLKGRVSFYKITDRSAFPKIKTENHEIVMSKTQYNLITKLYEDKEEGKKDLREDDENNNTFCIYERQLSISVYDKKRKNKVFENLREYAPKLELLFKQLKKPGKHVIYSNFIQYCLHLIALYLDSQGWSNYLKTGIKKDKTYVLWDASLKDIDKQKVKLLLNSIENMDGSKIKVVLGSPSIKEGISFKHIQHLHQIDPVWNSSAKEQIEGRCVRYKSHEDIPLNSSILKRQVIIHNYILVSSKELPLTTCDERIYNEIIPEKVKLISILEKLLGKISFDYYLWTSIDKSPKTKSTTSSISISDEDKENLENIIKKFKKGVPRKRNYCVPKLRRPINNKCSEPYIYLGKTKQGDKCCYKRKQKDYEQSPKEQSPKEQSPKEQSPIKTLNDFNDLYEVLEITPKATISNIKKAYKRLMEKYGNKQDMKKLLKIAYFILGNDKYRTYYNINRLFREPLEIKIKKIQTMIKNGQL